MLSDIGDMSSVRRRHYSMQDYLSAAEISVVKLEYFDGEIFGMVGGAPEHAAIAAETTIRLGSKLKSGCQAFSSDARIHVEATGLSTYPDVSIVCGPQHRSTKDPLALTTPIVLVEVTSPSTEDYDRGEKLSHYKQIPSLQAVVIVSHAQRRITVVSRAVDWETREYRPGEDVTVPGVDVTLSVDDFYGSVLKST
jgi:Uma2 family endonuclease